MQSQNILCRVKFNFCAVGNVEWKELGCFLEIDDEKKQSEDEYCFLLSS